MSSGVLKDGLEQRSGDGDEYRKDKGIGRDTRSDGTRWTESRLDERRSRSRVPISGNINEQVIGHHNGRNNELQIRDLFTDRLCSNRAQCVILKLFLICYN